MRISYRLVLTILAGLLSSIAVAQKPSPNALTKADQQFVKKAAQGGIAEVELGQLAQQKGTSDAVKQFGRRMVDDHTKANDQLKQIAQSKGISIPTSLNAKDKMTKEKLAALSGDSFDRAYMSHMVTDHKADVAEFDRESKSGADDDIKNFAVQTLPTLQDHLKQAQSISSNSSNQASIQH